ncbi:MAG: DUF6624 domain-containing protein [Patescibacteria group bacterium]
MTINKTLAKKINILAEKDQQIRKQAEKNKAWDKKIDISNTKEMKKIIENYGWPIISLVGEKASRNAWLLVQHADYDKKFQKYCLNLMEKIYRHNPKDIQKENIAYLKDRVLINQGKKQLFGTQFRFNKKQQLIPYPIRDKKNLEKNREEYDLPPFKDFLIMAKNYNKSIS